MLCTPCSGLCCLLMPQHVADTPLHSHTQITHTKHTKHTLKFLQPGVVEQLPKKVDNIVFCELRPAQKRAYKRLIESPDVQVGGLYTILYELYSL